MNVLVDVDSVVADLMPEWLRLYNNDYSDRLTVEQITEWDMTKFVHPDCGNKIYSYLMRSDLYDNVKPIKFAREGVQHIRNLGHRIIFVSSGVYAVGKLDWLSLNGFEPGRYGEDYIVAHDKSLIRGDLLIDDKWENILDFRLSTPIGTEQLLFTQPWNTQYEWSGFRVNGWIDIKTIFDEVYG